jgi:hypothetical protein
LLRRARASRTAVQNQLSAQRNAPAHDDGKEGAKRALTANVNGGRDGASDPVVISLITGLR